MLDFRKADKIYRDAIRTRQAEELRCDSLIAHHSKLVGQMEALKPSFTSSEKAVKTNDPTPVLTSRSRASFTVNQTFVGKCFIYVDPECRDCVIPVPT